MLRRRCLALCVLLSASGCGDAASDAQRNAPAAARAGDAQPPEQPVATPTPTPAPTPGVQTDGSIVSAVDWFSGSLDEALARAEQEKKLVFVDVGAYWCPPCHRLDEEVFVRPEVGEFLGQGYIAVHIDAEKGEGPEVAQRYKALAYPTMLVLEPSGIEKGRLVDFVPADELIAKLGAIAAGGNVLADLQAAAAADPDDLPAHFALGHAYALAARREQALEAFAVVEVADPKNELGLASEIAYDRAMFITYKLDGDLDRAIAQFRELQARYPESKKATTAYARIGRLLHLQGKTDEAIATLDAMLAHDPDSLSLISSYGWFSFRERCRPERGLAVVRRGIELHPDSAELRYLASELHHQLGQHAEALAAIEAAVAIEPESAFYKRMVAQLKAGTAVAG